MSFLQRVDPRTPKGQLGYAERTSNQGPIGPGSVITDLTGLSVTVNVEANRLIKISAQVRISGPGNYWGKVLIREGSTQLGSLVPDIQSFSGNPASSLSGFTIETPSAGAHTYKLSASYGDETGSMTSNASATEPAFIVVEDIGAAP